MQCSLVSLLGYPNIQFLNPHVHPPLPPPPGTQTTVSTSDGARNLLNFEIIANGVPSQPMDEFVQQCRTKFNAAIHNIMIDARGCRAPAHPLAAPGCIVLRAATV